MIVTINATEYTIKVLPQFSPLTDSAVKWRRATNGALLRADRGSATDVHTCSIMTAGAETDIAAVYGALTSAGNDGITSAVLEAGEYLFGPATDIAELPIVWLDVGELNQRTLTTWGFSATIALDGALVIENPPGNSTFFPKMFYPVSSAKIQATNGNNPRAFYDVAASGFDPTSRTTDSEEYTFSCVMDQADAAEFQAWYEATNRGAVVANVGPDFILSGQYAPFGPNYSFPCASIFRDVSFSPMGPQYWRVNVTLARAK